MFRGNKQAKKTKMIMRNENSPSEMFISDINLSYIRKRRLIGKISTHVQGALWLFNINIHNSYAGECTPDFSCCTDVRTKGFRNRLNTLRNCYKTNKEINKYIREEEGR